MRESNNKRLCSLSLTSNLKIKRRGEEVLVRKPKKEINNNSNN